MKKGLAVLIMLAVTAVYAGSIEGLVIDSLSRKPITGALVQASGIDSLSDYGEAYTDSFGYYLINNLDNGSYRVKAQKSGYVTKVYPGEVIVSGGITVCVDFELVPKDTLAGSISGVVLDSLTGKPILGAKVFSMTGYMWGDTATTYSDSSGFYVITDLAEGSYMVQAERFGYYPSMYPGIVEVYAGQNTPHIDFMLLPKDSIPSGFGAISGIVRDTMTGEPIMSARVYAMMYDSLGRDSSGIDSLLHEAYTDSSGFYRIDSMDAGSYVVSAEHEDYYPATYPDLVDVVDGQETSGIDFGLFPLDTTEGGSISGLVTDAVSGYPIMGALVRAQYPDSTSDSLTFEGEAYTDSLGYYVIDGLDPGFYKVTAKNYRYYPSTYPELVEVLDGENTPDIDFELVPRDSGYSWIRGYVRYNDGKAYSPGLALAFSPHGGILGMGIFTPFQDSVSGDTMVKYEIDDLPPNPCYVLGLALGYLPQLYDHAYTIEDATLVNPGSVRIDFDFDPLFPWRSSIASSSPGVSGTIQGKIGPLPTSAIYAKKDGEIFAGCVGGETGSYYLPLDPGEYSIYATRPGYETGEYVGTITVTNQLLSDIDIKLTPKENATVENQNPGTVKPSISLSVLPNPFTFNTTISYALPNPGQVSIKVYDVTGKLVRSLINTHQPAGTYSLDWDGRDDNGQMLSSGIYFCRIDHNRASKTTSLIVVK